MSSSRRTHKDRLQRRCMQALNNGDRFIAEVLVLKEEFGPQHPEYLELLDAIGQIVLMAEVSLGDFYRSAWGRRPAEFPGGGE